MRHPDRSRGALVRPASDNNPGGGILFSYFFVFYLLLGELYIRYVNTQCHQGHNGTQVGLRANFPSCTFGHLWV